MLSLLSQLPPPSLGKSGWPWVSESGPVPPEISEGQVWPRISIVTPSFNQGEYLEKAIRSVLLQGYPNLEYIVIDGGSTDNSVDIINKFEPRLTFWVSEKDRGQAHAINKGLTRATGDLLGWLNSDDCYIDGALFTLARAFLEDPSGDAVYGQGHIVSSTGAILYTPELRQVTSKSLEEWCFGNDFMQPSCLFSRRAWLECGPLDETLHFSLDVDFWLKIAERYDFRRIKDVLSLSLAHPGAKTTGMRNEMFVDLAVVLMRHNREAAARRVLALLTERLAQDGTMLKSCGEADQPKRLLRRIIKRVGL